MGTDMARWRRLTLGTRLFHCTRVNDALFLHRCCELVTDGAGGRVPWDPFSTVSSVCAFRDGWTPELGAPHGHQRSRKWLADRDVEERGKMKKRFYRLLVYMCQRVCVCVCALRQTPSPFLSLCSHLEVLTSLHLWCFLGGGWVRYSVVTRAGGTEPFPPSGKSTDWRLRSLEIPSRWSQEEPLLFHRQCLLGSVPRPPS